MSAKTHYADHRPYADPPAMLTDLTGPTTGMLELPHDIDWGPRRVYDMASETDRRIVYERVLREAASTGDVCRYVDGDTLAVVWNRLWLPARVRQMWEKALPALARAA